MADGFWNRQQPPLQQHSPGMLKRPRSDYDFPSAGVPSTHGMLGYLPRDDARGVSGGIKDTQSLGSAYDRYIQSGQLSFSSGDASYNFGSGDRSGRGIGGFPGLPPLGELPMMGGPRGVGLDVGANGHVSSAGQFPVDPLVRPERDVLPLPRDASSTIFVEGLPADSTKREVAHIFRPFLGYKEVRLVTKESKHRGGDPLILCFVDFESPACAATALNALQGYRMDDHESDSHSLRLQFARFPGARSGSGHRGIQNPPAQ